MPETTYKWSIFNYIVTKDKERVLVYNTYSLYYRWIYNEDFEFSVENGETSGGVVKIGLPKRKDSE